MYNKTPLTVGQILRWADAHYERTGRWPVANPAPIPGAPQETWRAIDGSLRFGYRGLPGDSSLAQLLAKYRGKPNHVDLPPWTYRQILAWADAHHARTGRWPKSNTGPVNECPENAWRTINAALRLGCRGLPGGSSLARLLQEHRGVQMGCRLPPLSVRQILEWADTHHERFNQWPNNGSRTVHDNPLESWRMIDAALRQGHRGLPGGQSLGRLLGEHRGVPIRTRRARRPSCQTSRGRKGAKRCAKSGRTTIPAR